MKKAIRFSICICLFSWLAYGILHLACGGEVKSNMLIFRAFETCYMLFPMIVAMVLQKIDGERFSATGLVNFRFSTSWLLAAALPLATVALCIFTSALMPGVRLHFGAEQMISQFSLDDAAADAVRKQMESVSPFVLIGSQLLSGIIAGCTINAVFAFGEEYGWRNYLVDALKGKSFPVAAIFIGLVWGIWHAPLILQGHNYPQHPVAGVGMMCVLCVLLGAMELYVVLKTRSVIPAAIMHGTFNAISGIALLCVEGGNDLLTGAPGLAGLISMGLILLLIYLYDRRHDRIMSNGLNFGLKSTVIQ